MLITRHHILHSFIMQGVGKKLIGCMGGVSYAAQVQNAETQAITSATEKS